MIIRTRFILCLCLVIFVGLVSRSEITNAQTGEWSRPFPLSGVLRGSWNPAVAADIHGQVHLVWAVSDANTTVLYYSHFDGLAWSRAVDISLGGPRVAMAIDEFDRVHLSFDNDKELTYMHSNVTNANSAKNWEDPYRLNETDTGYTSAIAVDGEGRVHIAWTEDEPACSNCVRVTYANSDNGGVTWGAFKTISASNADPQRVQIRADKSNKLYVVWDVVNPQGKNNGIGYTHSSDGGETWTNPQAVTEPGFEIYQSATAIDKNGNQLLIYRSFNKDEIFYRISTDDGSTFGDQQIIPGIFAAKLTTGNDRYAILTDREGIVHLVAAGRRTKDQNPFGIYALEWNGSEWSALQTVYEGDDLAELPSVAIGNGNRLHVAFATRNKNRVGGVPDASFKVLYSTSLIAAQEATSVPIPTATPTPEASATDALTTPTPRPTRTRAPSASQSTAQGDSAPNPQLPIALAVVPVVLLLVVILAMTAMRRGMTR